ncbi:hypothetical protein [uncultured Nostoc sp.]
MPQALRYAIAIDGNRHRAASRREDCDPLTALRLHELPLHFVPDA